MIALRSSEPASPHRAFLQYRSVIKTPETPHGKRLVSASISKRCTLAARDFEHDFACRVQSPLDRERTED